MKRLSIAIIMVLALASLAMAQTWYPANQVTFAWDAVALPQCTCSTPPCTTTVVCPGPDFPSPAVGTIKYQVYSRNDLVSNGVKVGGEITATELVVTFNTWGDYYLGVESMWIPSGQTVPIRSLTKAWSNVVADTKDGVAFGIRFMGTTLAPKGLYLK